MLQSAWGEPDQSLHQGLANCSESGKDGDLFDFVQLGFEHVLAPPSIVWVVFVKLDWTNTR